MARSGNAAGHREPEDVDRIKRAIDGRLAGKTYDEIGASLGVTKQAAWSTVQKALAETLREPADRLREVEVARLDRLTVALWPMALGEPATEGGAAPSPLDQARAVLRLVQISDRRAKLLGLDAPVEIKVTEPIEDRAARLAGELAAFQAGRRAQAENPDVPANGNGKRKANGTG